MPFGGSFIVRPPSVPSSLSPLTAFSVKSGDAVLGIAVSFNEGDRSPGLLSRTATAFLVLPLVLALVLARLLGGVVVVESTEAVFLRWCLVLDDGLS